MKPAVGVVNDDENDGSRQKKPSGEVLPSEIDVEEIPCEEAPVKPERDFQPPRVNTFFNEAAAATNDKKVRKENRKLKKAIQAI